jgi:hypothetical protein
LKTAPNRPSQRVETAPSQKKTPKSSYHIMYGASPFQEALDRGASLPLAVIK